MKKAFCVINLLLMMTVPFPLSDGRPSTRPLPPRHSLQIRLHLPKQALRRKEAVQVRVEFRSMGREPVVLPAVIELPFHWIDFEVKREGRLLPYRGGEPTVQWTNKTITLAPEYHWGKDVPLNLYYDLSKPGNYSLRCI